MENPALNARLILSEDGSHTLRVDELNENYHSHKGAIRESLHVFIEMGLYQFDKNKQIRILEVGFGTGLNALLTCLNNHNGEIEYHTLETNILPESLTSQLNYPKQLEDSRATQLFAAIHQSPWGQKFSITEHFHLFKWNLALQEIESIKPNPFDLIYYDAFAPHAQPELWTADIWKLIASHLKPSGILVTYCAKGQVRRDMQAAGLIVERLQGPPGKREMIRATKQ